MYNTGFKMVPLIIHKLKQFTIVKNKILVLFIILIVEKPAFQVCAQTNDNCASAIALQVGSSCNSSVFENVSATAEPVSVAPDPSCGVYKGGDVWFTLEMPSSGALRIETSNLASATPHSIVMYTGTCGAFTEIRCIQLDKQKTIFDPSLAGQTLYIRMYNYNSTNGSSFELCVWEPPIPFNDNCQAAIELTPGETCNFGTYSNAYATSEPDAIAKDPSCGAYKGGDVWFKTIIPPSGNLRIETRNLWSATSIPVAVYTGICGSFTEVFCNQLDDEATYFDPGWAGQTAYIRIFSYDTEEGGDFELCVFSPGEPANDDCENAIEISAGVICDARLYSNALATSQPATIAPDPSCGAYRGGDVWFRTGMPSSGNLRLETENLTGATSLSMTLYTGTCGSLSEVFCNELDSKESFNNPSLAGQTLYLRIFSYNSEEGGPFTLCVYDSPCEDVTQDAGNLSICKGDRFIFGSQILTGAGSYSELFETRAGCDSLVNLTLSVDPIYDASQTISLCEGESYTFPDGTIHESITEDLTQISRLKSVRGCDSLITTTITVKKVDNSVNLNALTLTANAGAAAYQWIDCSNGSIPVPGKNEQTFSGEPGGEYAVIITENGCSRMSDCYLLNVVGLDLEENREIKIYPNPATEILFIEFDRFYDPVNMELIGFNGQSFGKRYIDGISMAKLDISHLSSGLYILKIITAEKAIRIRFMKE